MAISIKFTKFDNTPWGFRLAGGSDFPQPLTVIRVTEGSLAECMGLKVGDVVVRLNDQPISCLTHGQAHEALLHAGNNFVLGVQREEEARKAAEAISEENIVPYKIALADLPPLFPEQILKEETVIERYEEETVEQIASAEDEVRQEEEKLAEEKPVDADSEIVPNKNLTDDEIAQLILEEEELLSDQGLLGVNFKKLRPRASILKGSKVLEELQNISTAEPERVQELKHTSTFLRKPQRPVPKPKSQPTEEDDGETYRVVIKKQDKKTVIARLVEKGLLPSGSGIPKTPEPPYEVNMHETKSDLKEDCPEIDPNPSRSTLSSDTTGDLLSPHFDTNEMRPLEAQMIHAASASSELPHVGPSPHRASIGELAQKPVRRSSMCARAHYAERILLEKVNIFGEQPLSEPPRAKKSRVVSKRKARMRGKYLATYLKRESARLISLLTTLFQFLRKADVSEPSEASRMRRRRSSVKGYYLEHVLQKNVAPMLQCVKETCLVAPADHYQEIDSAQKDEPKSTRNFKVHELFVEYIRKVYGWLENGSSSRKESAVVTFDDSDEWKENRSACVVKFAEKNPSSTTNASDSPIVIEEITDESERDVPECEDFIEGSSSSQIIDTVPEEEHALSQFLQSTEDYISAEVFHRGHRRLSKPRKSIDVIPKEDKDGLSKILQSTEDYISSEVFHRGHRRLSKPRKSIDVIPKEDKDGLSKILQSTEDYLSSEVFHRGHRRLSKPRKSIDVIPKEDKDGLSKILQSTEDYLSSEVFHRGHRRLSRTRKSIDVIPKEDKDGFSKLLQSTEDYISSEVFHRGSRRLSRPRKSIDVIPKEDKDGFSELLQSTEDYISSEVFHRGSRRLSRRLSKDSDLENGALSDLLRSTGDYVSNEVFHRRSRRLSRASKKDLPCTGPIWWDGLKGMRLSLPWFSLRVTDEKSTEHADVCTEKIDPEIEHDSRRLSFVPTILYQGITNRIGVDFTRLVAYAFVPCTSIVLLYLYK
ncbi:uncharacterized protein LOC105186101 isoform X1 [Harpegnathos saltator]|uniref:uncharacterized protein LOC105186101 isoform X1 n=1 Tax=Harpegnathos saltator TaxID=610380 RepID=UPI000DBEDBF8|nr:uncharacterized protein LOC105186101 isoform X1 [Harpegnathos saltator]XP_011144399.2 uncharacterized protein LOC105186101 isoform X1 [Harpegnathos saltator]